MITRTENTGPSATDLTDMPAQHAPSRRGPSEDRERESIQDFTGFARIATPLGEMIVAVRGESAETRAVAGIYFSGQRHQSTAAQLGVELQVDDDPLLSQAAKELGEYFAGERSEFTLPVHAQGSDFEHRVWALLRRLPYGTTTSYGELANRLGNRHLAQGVGQAVGHNPLSVVVPCHRVLGADGSLTGYAGGVERKRALLALERQMADEQVAGDQAADESVEASPRQPSPRLF